MQIRKLAVVLTSGVLLGGLVGAPAVWAHEGHSHGSSDDGDFTVYGRFTDFEHEDNGEDGWSEDDVVTFAYDLFQKGEGQVGDGDGECVITKLNKQDRDFEADCDGVFDLDDGQLDLEGTVTDEDFRDGKIEMDVIDGTGDYDNATGSVTITRPDGHGHGDGKGHGAKHDKASYHTASADSVVLNQGDGHKGGGKHKGGGHGGGHWFRADVDLD